jgi:DNA-binding CsgD family transcriptional regulator
MGRYEEAAALSEEATAGVPRENYIAQLFHLWFMVAIDVDRGESTWMESHRAVFEARPLTLAWFTLPWSLLSAGRRDEAVAYYEQARGSLHRVPRDARWMPTMVLLTEVSSQFEDRETTEICYRQLLPFQDRFAASGGGTVSCLGSVALFLGMAAMTLGRFDDGEGHLRRAIQRNSAVGARPWTARAQLLLADLLRRQGRARGQALDLAHKAADTATALGMRVLRTRAEAVIDNLTAATGPVLLSRREREVAALVARGLTNREIARTLFLSERTAENHVQHILTKLGFGARAQIAAWAVAEGLSTPEGTEYLPEVVPAMRRASGSSHAPLGIPAGHGEEPRWTMRHGGSRSGSSWRRSTPATWSRSTPSTTTTWLSNGPSRAR